MQSVRVTLASIVAAVAIALPALAETTDIKVGVKGRMTATLIAPDGPGPYPGVLILHTSGGLRPTDIDYARRLSDQGYVCLVPAFMEAYGLTARTRAQTFTNNGSDVYRDLAAAAETLRASPKVAGGKVGAVGFSNGGYFALWLAATNKIDAGVSYYGALSGAGTDKELTRFSSTFHAGSAPVLVLHGTADRTVPVAAAERLVAILKHAQSPYEVKLYDGADHVFEREQRNDAARMAAADAWERTQRFLGEQLRPVTH
jgi:carboxymethylenebutenolidase